jgi:hypothetical protein
LVFSSNTYANFSVIPEGPQMQAAVIGGMTYNVEMHVGVAVTVRRTRLPEVGSNDRRLSKVCK